jgi:hypothetical protein
MKKNIYILLALAVILIASAENSFACSCVVKDEPLEKQIQNAFADSGAVFSGVVMAVEPAGEYAYSVTIKTASVWKGEVMKEFTVTTARQSAMCGYNFEVGKKYLVYANQSGDELMVNNCSRTTVFNDDGDAKYLKKFLKDPDQTEAVLITQFTFNNKEVLLLELDNYVNRLQDAPTARGYIIINGNKKSRSDATKQIRKQIKNRGLDSKRVIFINGKGDSKAVIELWLVPPGAQPPTAKKYSSDKPMESTALNTLIEELKGVVSKLTPDKNEAKTVAKKWDQRKDLTGKTKKDVIDLLYEDVKSVIKDSGTQYQIFPIFSFYKNIPVTQLPVNKRQ